MSVINVIRHAHHAQDHRVKNANLVQEIFS